MGYNKVASSGCFSSFFEFWYISIRLFVKLEVFMSKLAILGGTPVDHRQPQQKLQTL
jgi:hypothetical protein